MNSDQDQLPSEPKVFSVESKLSKFLTGIDYDQNPKDCLDQISRKRQEVSEKYGLKLPEDFSSWKDYASYLIENARERNAVISWTSQVRLNDEGHSAGIKEDGTLVMPEINLETCSQIEAFNWAVKMGHELVHTRQVTGNFEESEYEACAYANLAMINYLNKEEYGELEGVRNYMACNEFFSLVRNSVEYDCNKAGINFDSLDWVTQKVE